PGREAGYGHPRSWKGNDPSGQSRNSGLKARARVAAPSRPDRSRDHRRRRREEGLAAGAVLAMKKFGQREDDTAVLSALIRPLPSQTPRAPAPSAVTLSPAAPSVEAAPASITG